MLGAARATAHSAKIRMEPFLNRRTSRVWQEMTLLASSPSLAGCPSRSLQIACPDPRSPRMRESRQTAAFAGFIARPGDRGAIATRRVRVLRAPRRRAPVRTSRTLCPARSGPRLRHVRLPPTSIDSARARRARRRRHRAARQRPDGSELGRSAEPDQRQQVGRRRRCSRQSRPTPRRSSAPPAASRPPSSTCPRCSPN